MEQECANFILRFFGEQYILCFVEKNLKEVDWKNCMTHVCLNKIWEASRDSDVDDVVYKNYCRSMLQEYARSVPDQNEKDRDEITKRACETIRNVVTSQMQSLLKKKSSKKNSNVAWGVDSEVATARVFVALLTKMSQCQFFTRMHECCESYNNRTEPFNRIISLAIYEVAQDALDRGEEKELFLPEEMDCSQAENVSESSPEPHHHLCETEKGNNNTTKRVELHNNNNIAGEFAEGEEYADDDDGSAEKDDDYDDLLQAFAN
jgi:hypothetical protein